MARKTAQVSVSYLPATSDRLCDSCSRKRRGHKSAGKYATFSVAICRARWMIALCRTCLLETVHDFAVVAEKID